MKDNPIINETIIFPMSGKFLILAIYKKRSGREIPSEMICEL